MTDAMSCKYMRERGRLRTDGNNDTLRVFLTTRNDDMPTLLEVCESRLGIQEVPGSKHNPIIVGWFADIGHSEVVDDETSWCSVFCASASKEAGLPMPPVNVRMMARSWLTWGVGVDLDNIMPGDVAVWSRGDDNGWQGHVNVVKQVRKSAGKVQVRCIGGNQSGLKGGDAVTLTGWLDASRALGFRRPVEATVQALRKAGSTEIKKGDQIQNVGWLSVLAGAIVATIKELLAPVTVPQFPSLPEQLGFWQQVLGGVNAVGGLFLEHPYIAGCTILGIVAVLVGRQLKARRVAKHAQGVPLSVEVEAAN